MILLDVMMPGLDGFEVCRILMSNPDTEKIPVVFLTALNDIKDKVAIDSAQLFENLQRSNEELYTLTRKWSKCSWSRESSGNNLDTI